MVQQLEIPWWPGDRTLGTRKVPFSKHLFIEQDDFSADPPADWKRLAVGREVRLFGAYFVRCDGVDRDPQSGAVTGLRCSVDLHTKGGEAPDGRQPAATLHWVDARQSVEAEVRLYDRLFGVEQPDADGDFVQHLNPDSLQVVRGHLEPALRSAAVASSYQFMRLGYFCIDGVDAGQSSAGVWNRTIGLRDSWARAKGTAKPDAAPVASAPAVVTPSAAEIDAAMAAVVAADPRLAALAVRGQVEAAQLGRLAQHPDRLAFWEASLETAVDGAAALRWLHNDLVGLAANQPLAGMPGSPREFGLLVALVHGGQLTVAAAKTLLARWVVEGGDPAALAEREGLRRDQADGRIAAAVVEVIQAHAAEVARYRSGETKLIAVLLGAAMRTLKGADPQAVRAALLQQLDAA
jgi:glutaminyl-tRNA synthetase